MTLDPISRRLLHLLGDVGMRLFARPGLLHSKSRQQPTCQQRTFHELISRLVLNGLAPNHASQTPVTTAPFSRMTSGAQLKVLESPRRIRASRKDVIMSIGLRRD